MQVQHELGADIMMAFDDCPPAGKNFEGDASAYAERVQVANERTLRWLERCIKTHHDSGRGKDQALFPIVQGGTDLAQRDWCVDRVCSFDSPGYAIGGVAVNTGTIPSKALREAILDVGDRSVACPTMDDFAAGVHDRHSSAVAGAAG